MTPGKILFCASALLLATTANATLMVFKSGTTAANATQRDAWLTVAGITAPECLAGFESGVTTARSPPARTRVAACP